MRAAVGIVNIAVDDVGGTFYAKNTEPVQYHDCILMLS